MVRDYVSGYYRPAQGTYLQMTDDPDSVSAFVTWQQRIRAAWDDVVVTALSCNAYDALAAEKTITQCQSVEAGQTLSVSCSVKLGDLCAEDVSVEAIYGAVDESDELYETHTVVMKPIAEGDFHVDIPMDTPGTVGVTVRVVPKHPLLVSPAELGLCTYAS